jgi:hypothetical protein
MCTPLHSGVKHSEHENSMLGLEKKFEILAVYTKHLEHTR